jgi:hypothetical protein
MALIQTDHPSAIKPLARMLAETPLPGYDGVSSCSSFATALCSWVEHSDRPEIKAAIAEYDRVVDTPGAWKALCASTSR